MVVNAWFVRQRGRALATVTFVAAFASVIFIPLATELSQALGWRAALLVLSVILGLGTIPLHLLVLRRSQQDLGLQPDGDAAASIGSRQPLRQSVPVRTALRDSAFWWLMAGFTLTTLAASALTVHLIPHLLDQGYDARFGALAAGTIGAMKVSGAAGVCAAERRMASQHLAALLVLCQALAVLILVLVPEAYGVIGGAALFGAASGAGTLARPASAGRVLRRRPLRQHQRRAGVLPGRLRRRWPRWALACSTRSLAATCRCCGLSRWFLALALWRCCEFVGKGRTG